MNGVISKLSSLMLENNYSNDPIATSDYVEVAQRLVGEFRDEQCQLVIALTHMREPNDIRLG